MGGSRIHIPLLLITAIAVVWASRSAAQGNASSSPGARNLTGMWLNNTATPLERPPAFADKPYFSEEEALAYEKRYLFERAAAANRETPFELEVGADIDTFEPGRVLRTRRTSLIVDPPDGKVPALTPEARRRLADRTAYLRAHPAEKAEDLPLGLRCLMFGGSSVGPPMLPVIYNNHLQIVQSGNVVMILIEMIHDTRVIPTDGRAHLPSSIRQWKGDSIGRWDGDTLIVDTTNFTDKTAFRGSAACYM
jgi:hypothetical protein